MLIKENDLGKFWKKLHDGSKTSNEIKTVLRIIILGYSKYISESNFGLSLTTAKPTSQLLLTLSSSSSIPLWFTQQEY